MSGPRRLCERHTGVGGDGVIYYTVLPDGTARMRLINADGSPSELSGNGLRCLAALVLHQRGADAEPLTTLRVDTDAGWKTLTLAGRSAAKYTFRAAMGAPERITQETLDVAGERLPVVIMTMANPQCVALVPELYEEFGGFTLGIVFAHELGHAIQERAGVAGPTIMRELQADCFAGAWTADVEDGGAEHFEVGIEDLDRAVAGFLELRDEVGVVRADHPAAHGTGFDRIGAFVEGYEHGASRCAAYPDEFAAGDHLVVEVPFSQADFQTGGNLPDIKTLYQDWVVATYVDKTGTRFGFTNLQFGEEGTSWGYTVDLANNYIWGGRGVYKGAMPEPRWRKGNVPTQVALPYGASYETFTNADMLELETLGPLVRLGPGEAVEHVERWELIGGVEAAEGPEGAVEAVLPLLNRD